MFMLHLLPIIKTENSKQRGYEAAFELKVVEFAEKTQTEVRVDGNKKHKEKLEWSTINDEKKKTVG